MPPLTGELKISNHIAFDFGSRTVQLPITHTKTTGIGEDEVIEVLGKYQGACTFAEILDGATATQKNIIKAMFKKAKVLCINNVVVPDTPVTASDIDDDME